MLIQNARVFTMEGALIEHGWLETEGNRIKALGAMDTVPVTTGEVFDAKGGSLLPGLVDAHTHLGMWEDSLGFEGDDGNEKTDPSTPHLSAVDAVNPLDRCFSEAREAGVTTVVTGPGSANPVSGQLIAMKTAGRRIDDMLLKAPIAIKFALGENPKTVYHDRDETPTTRMATAAIIREQLLKTMRYRQKLLACRENEELEEPEFDYKCEALLPLFSGEVQAHFHAHRADDIFTALRIAKEFELDAVIVHATEGHLIAEELAAGQVKVLSGPFLCDRSKPELKNQTPTTPGQLVKAGLFPALITDHPVIPTQYLTLCAALAVREGMDRAAALRAITIRPAEILHLEDRVGSLRVGKDADLVVFDGDPLDFYAHTTFVAVNGKRVK
ncbi:MAG: amidohydrolase [Ethanoligenens sp.]|uniref:amidohydrolase n=1 Tax=Ethanoligenens sp. TaxID=2099655 RepID=UPI0039ED4BC0